MKVDQTDLDRWAAACERACCDAEQAELLLMEGDLHRAHDLVTRARITAWTTYRALFDAGAKAANGAGVAREVPLHLLDTPATRRLLNALRTAVEAAADMDRERGWVLTDGTPCGFAETLGEQAECLRQEVEGPKGRGEGGV